MVCSFVICVPDIVIFLLQNSIKNIFSYRDGVFMAILVSSIVLPSIFISAFAPFDKNSLKGWNSWITF